MIFWYRIKSRRWKEKSRSVETLPCSAEIFILNIFCIPPLTNFSTLGIQMIICSHELLKRYSAQFPCIWVFIPLLNLYSILDLKGNVIGFAFWEGCLEYSKSIIFLLLVGGKIPRISSGHHVVLPLPFYPTFYSLSPSSGVSVIPPC